MKRMIALFLAMLLLTGCGAAKVTQDVLENSEAPTETEQAAEQTEVVKDGVIPFGEFYAESLDGGAATQGVFAAADLTVVNIWATYCGPCKAEMPVLAKLDEELDNVQVLGIVLDCVKQDGTPDPDQVQVAIELAEAAGVTYTNLILNMELAKLGVASVESVPATLFVDKQGNLVGQGIYGAMDEATWREVIAQRLEMTAQ